MVKGEGVAVWGMKDWAAGLGPVSKVAAWGLQRSTVELCVGSAWRGFHFVVEHVLPCLLPSTCTPTQHTPKQVMAFAEVIGPDL